MSEYRNTFVGIKGDGNAVGDNNRITVNKKVDHHHHHRNGSDKNDGSWVWGVAMLALIAIAASCYYFSRHADAIYLTLEVAGWVETLAALVATAVYANRTAYGVAGKTAVAMICAFSVALISSNASANYHPGIVELANGTESFKTFWCSLNVYGRQVAMLHTLAGSVVLTPVVLLLLGPTLIPAFFAAVEMEVTSSFYKIIEWLTSWKLIVTAGVLIVLAGYAHSDAGWNTWVETIRTPPAWPLCPR